MDISKMIENMEKEAENMAVGHEVINSLENAKLFNQSALENVVIDKDDFSEYPGEADNDMHSTFDEANYTVIYDE